MAIIPTIKIETEWRLQVSEGHICFGCKQEILPGRNEYVLTVTGPSGTKAGYHKICDDCYVKVTAQ